MAFAEPRPNRRPFHVFKDSSQWSIAPQLDNGNLAITSFTVSSQSGRARYVTFLSRKRGEDDYILLMVLVKGGDTLHFPFPHPMMVGTGRSLVAQVSLHTGALIQMTVVGYEW